MPTYAYACKSCGHRFDAVQSFSDPALTVCDECGGPLRKEYGSIGVTFNGSGFYRTDSRSAKSTSDAASSGSSASGKSDSGSSGAKDTSSAGSKPEATPSPASSGS